MAEAKITQERSLIAPGPTDSLNSNEPSAGEPAFYRRRKRRNNEICQILIRSGDVKPEDVRQALRIQEERGGQVGRILVRMGACSERAIARALMKQVQLAHSAGARKSLSSLARSNPALAGLETKCSPGLTVLALVCCDLAVLFAIGALAAWVERQLLEQLSHALIQYGFGALAVCFFVFLAFGVYAPTAPSPPNEIRATTLLISLVFACQGLIAAFGTERIAMHVHVILFCEWFACIFLVPIARAVLRGKLSRYAFWGAPVVVLGAGKTGRNIVRALQSRPTLGLRPVFILDDDLRKHGTLRASLAPDNEIEVNSIRNIPVQPLSRLEAQSSPEAAPPTIRSPSSFPPGATLPSSPFAARPASDPPSVAAAGAPRRTISEPSMAAVVPPGMAAAGAPRRTISEPSMAAVVPPSIRSVSDPPIVPSSPFSSRMRDGASISSAPPSQNPSSDPNWLDHLPESHRGLIRGQFSEIEGVPIIGGLELVPLLAQRLGISYGILAMPGQGARKLLQVTERIGGALPHLLVIPDLFGLASMGVPSREVGGILGVEVNQQLLLAGPRLAKRVMDVIFTCLGSIFVFPIIFGLALLIALDSKGSVFYRQKRIGRDGKTFVALKFRTMHGDGETRLKAVLEQDPKLRAEYEEFHKLNDDPRVTRVGRILRKYSLDELPQLWNVVRGEMSLVGPRPYLEREIPDMMHNEGIILRALPGMTGLWQVSDRNATGFSERVRMDVHYVRNWSPWLDIYILARTIGVVIHGTGV